MARKQMVSFSSASAGAPTRSLFQTVMQTILGTNGNSGTEETHFSSVQGGRIWQRHHRAGAFEIYYAKSSVNVVSFMLAVRDVIDENKIVGVFLIYKNVNMTS